MEQDQYNIESMFKRTFEGYEVHPSPELWPKLESKLVVRQFLRFSWHSFNLYYIAAPLLIITSALLLLNPSESVQKHTGNMVAFGSPAYSDLLRSTTAHQNDNPVQTPLFSFEPAQDRVTQPEETHRTALVDSLSETDPLVPMVAVSDTATEEISTIPHHNESQLLADASQDLDSLPASVSPFTNQARISASVNKGCAPLAVQFSCSNTTGTQCVWSFGGGNLSREINPVFVFEKPGRYGVTLSVYEGGRLISQLIDSVIVNPSPEAIAVVEEQGKTAGDVLFCYNYSKNAVSQEWYLDDEMVSSEKDPVLDVSGQTSKPVVKLKVTGIHACVDSMVLDEVVTDRPPCQITFPTAFTPNLSGPSDGHYDPADRTNDVFHPFCTSGIEKYKLKIIDRWSGMVVFETTDIAVGWDGYYQQSLAREDVYIWKVEGQVAGGRHFAFAGNVTLLHLP